jgi:hypothetical protein
MARSLHHKTGPKHESGGQNVRSTETISRTGRDAADRLARNAALAGRSVRDTAAATVHRLEVAAEHAQERLRGAATDAGRYTRTHPALVLGLVVAAGAIIASWLTARR